MVNHVIIMAGGGGKRLWPASSNSQPKQFMTVQGGKTLFTGTIERAASLGIDGKILVVTHKDHVKAALKDCQGLSPETRKRVVILAEPEAKNTGPALAYAAAWLKSGPEDASALVLAADHLIENLETFREDVQRASLLAERGKLVVYGIPPTSAATGYGYIEAGAKEGPGFVVNSFKEKPTLERAQAFVAAGNYYWNSGMFTYRLSTFEQELSQATPAMMAPFLKGFRPPQGVEEEGVLCIFPDPPLHSLYASLPKESIDYALMEKSRTIGMVPAHFDWNDVGSWDVIAGLNSPENQEGVFIAGGEGNFVHSDIPVALCGVQDLIVIIRNNKALVCKKGQSQLVKDAAEALGMG